MLWWTCLIFFDGQGWRSGESTRLPPMSPGFPSRRWRHMWVLKFLLVLSLALRGFSPGTPVFPCPKKRTFSKNSNSTRNQVDKEPFSGCATSKSLSIYLFIYVFIIFVSNTEFLEKQLHRGRAFPNELKCRAYSEAALIQIKTVL